MLATTSAFGLSAAAFVAPTLPARATRATAQMGVEDMAGKYSLTGQIFDPLGLANKFDVNWMREAEIKHGRVTMLAFMGFIANDAGIKFPGEVFEGVSSIEAHDAMVKSGHMWALLAFVGGCEFLHLLRIAPMLDTDWDGVEPGNYGFDPFKLDSPARREAELKNGRAAMIAFSGLITQAALGAPPPYINLP